MKINKFVICFVVILFNACTGGGGGGGTSGTTTPGAGLSCPAGYVLVPGLSGYEAQEFCVAKYEMKNNSGAKSEAAGTPWDMISRDSAITACQSLGAGYDLISNAQWQTIARNVADVASNWSSATAYNGELNRGHTDNTPSSALSSDVSDANSCSGTGQTCSNSTWNSQRRTHVLSNGEVIWDFAGNIWEWVKDDYTGPALADDYVSLFNSGDSRQINYGNDQFCAMTWAPPFCGFGHGWTFYVPGAIIRGGYWMNDDTGGVFAANLANQSSATLSEIGFRCSYQP